MGGPSLAADVAERIDELEAQVSDLHNDLKTQDLKLLKKIE